MKNLTFPHDIEKASKMMRKNCKIRKKTIFVLLATVLLFCACTAAPTNQSESSSAHSSIAESSAAENSVIAESSVAQEVSDFVSDEESIVSEPTESELLELMELRKQQVNQMLDEYRPEEAYQYPDFSGEITDVRVTVRERELDWYIWEGSLADENTQYKKAYDIWYGYQSDGVWYDFPSGNFDLRELNSVEWLEILEEIGGLDEDPEIEETIDSSWLVSSCNHVVEIGPYLLLAFPVGVGEVSEAKPVVAVRDSLDTSAIEITEYYSIGDSKLNWHFLENMRAYGTDEYDAFMTSISQWYFLILRKDLLTEDYMITVQQDWNEPYYDAIDTYTYDIIMNALEHS